MKFKDLQLQGFKSFVDRTIIEFPGGITAVVGPNGSGKSNILDGIRWVFGEQSAKELRGSDMDDIIFQGSENRKATGVAEVTLTLSDLPESVTSKWGTLSEIAVTRKYYRTGEREYRINNRKCRLKDIREIFYDTGLGARSISIIEQGKVEKIIQSSPEELRHFFEETAGVVRFKERKKEAERRLRQTQENLSRVNDIIIEVKTSLDTLTSQVETVKKYRDLSSRKQELTKNIQLYKYERILEDLTKVKESLSEKGKGFEGALSRFNKLNEEQDKLQIQLSELRHKHRGLQDKKLEVHNSMNKAESDIRVLEKDIESAENLKNTLHHNIEDDEQKLRELTERRVTLLEQKEEMASEKATISEKINESQERIEDLIIQRDDLNDEMMELDSNYLEWAESSTRIRNQIFEHETRVDRATKDRTRVEEEQKELEEEAGKVKSMLADAESALERLKTEMEAVVDASEAESERLEDAKAVLEDSKSEKDELQLEVAGLKSRADILQKQLDSVSGGSIGKDMLDELGGKLVFEVMDKSKVRPELADIIVFPAANRDMVLEKISVQEGSLRFTFDDMLDEFSKYSETFEQIQEKIVRVQGVYRKFGADDTGLRLYEIKNELESCLNEIVVKEEALEIAVEKVEEASEILDEIKDRLDTLVSRKQEIQVDLRASENRKNETEERVVRLRKRYEVLKSELDQFARDKENSLKEIERLKKEGEEINEKLSEIDEKKSAYDERLDEIQIIYDDLRDELGVFKVEERGVAEKLNAVVKDLHFVDRELNEAAARMSKSKERLSKLMTVDIINLKERLDNLKHTYNSLLKGQMEVDEESRKADSEISDHENKSIELKKELDKADRDLKENESGVNDLRMKESRLTGDVENIKESFLEKFERDIENEEADLTEFQPNKAKTELELVNKEIDLLGPLNMAAEQEYDEVFERHEFMSGQRKDLEDSIASIFDLMGEIDDSTVLLFKETFEGVKANFGKVFSILFGKGECDLRLSEPDNLLESGIEIFVQPPGKKLQNMNLLSGGEKAMSACTLLFALFLYKPTPFCFLDEIDAPLDDSNIDRFLKVVKTLSNDTQFVIITHNQKTMAESDSLYGITMQEPGVSKVLSVQLEQLN